MAVRRPGQPRRHGDGHDLPERRRRRLRAGGRLTGCRRDRRQRLHRLVRQRLGLRRREVVLRAVVLPVRHHETKGARPRRGRGRRIARGCSARQQLLDPEPSQVVGVGARDGVIR